MLLEKLKITNFCSCRDVDLDLRAYNPIIGYNNSGKSNIVRAVNWLLKKSVLSPEKFFDQNQPVIVEGVVSGVAAKMHLLPPLQQRQVTPYVIDDKLSFRRKQDTPGGSARDVRIEVKDDQGNWVANPTGLDNAIGVLFPDPIYVQAMDDAESDVGKATAKNTIGLLLKYVIDQIVENQVAINAVQAALAQVEQHLNGPARLNELSQLELDASAAIRSFFPGLALHLDIKTPKLEELVKSAEVSLSHAGGVSRSFASFGHGAQRTVQMALIKLLASRAAAGQNGHGTVVLLIDEPELYLHPQAIEILRDSLKSLSSHGFQVIFSTHSPLLIDRDDVLATSIIYNEAPNGTVVRRTLASATQAMQQNANAASVIYSLQNSSYILFSERIILVEGKTEQIVLPEVYKVVKGASLASNRGYMVGAAGSGTIKPLMEVLRGIGYEPRAVVDLDYAFKTAPLCGLLAQNNPEIAACVQWFRANQATHQCNLDPSGLPQKGGVNNAATGYEILAQHMPNEIGLLKSQLLNHDIWLWDRGAIEAHLGTQKNETAYANFLSIMKTAGNLVHAADANGLSALMHWLA
ncbi:MULTISPECIES: ATP-dependent nuclease [Cupriavidus]